MLVHHADRAPVIIKGEISSAAERAGRAGNVDELWYVGAGASSIVFRDDHGSAYKVARSDFSKGMLRDEAEWFRDANKVLPWNTALLRSWNEDEGVLEVDYVEESDRPWPSKLYDFHVKVEEIMLRHGWTAPEYKEDSYVYRNGVPVLVDAGMAYRVGDNLVRYILDVLDGRRPRGRLDDNQSFAFNVRAEVSRGTIDVRTAQRLFARLK